MLQNTDIGINLFPTDNLYDSLKPLMSGIR